MIAYVETYDLMLRTLFIMHWLAMYCISAEGDDLPVVLIALVFVTAPVLEVYWKLRSVIPPAHVL
jgi:hypothetical protein